MASAAELSQEGLIPGHGTFNHEASLELGQLRTRYNDGTWRRKDRDKLTTATGSRFDFDLEEG